MTERGYRIKNHDRLGDDTGYQIRTHEGPVINLYDTGSITVTGNNRHLFEDVDSLRLLGSNTGVLVVASNDNADLLHLSMRLRGWGLSVDGVFFGHGDWMDAVAKAKKGSFHTLALVSLGTPVVSTGTNQSAVPDVYFGLGLLVGRITREHLTVIWNDAVDMPHSFKSLGTEVMRYARQVQEIDDDLRLRLRSAGLLSGEHEAATLY